MSGFLEQMARSSAARAAEARARVSESELLALAAAAPAPPPLVFDAGGFDLIAESKLRSPAVGRLASGAGGTGEEIAARVLRYAQAGAAAVSVLTEPTRFDGSLGHLEATARALNSAARRVPAMRKDFLIDPYQVLEARVAGAGGVLVILRMLSDEAADALLDCAREHGLFVLLEAFDEADIERARAIVAARASGTRAGSPHGRARAVSPHDEANASLGRHALLVGVNCRDLDTLQVVPGRLEALAAQLPASVPRVAESGVGSAGDAARVAAAGYDLALVGSALMAGADPAALVRSMLEAGRNARGPLAYRADDAGSRPDDAASRAAASPHAATRTGS